MLLRSPGCMLPPSTHALHWPPVRLGPRPTLAAPLHPAPPPPPPPAPRVRLPGSDHRAAAADRALGLRRPAPAAAWLPCAAGGLAGCCRAARGIPQERSAAAWAGARRGGCCSACCALLQLQAAASGELQLCGRPWAGLPLLPLDVWHLPAPVPLQRLPAVPAAAAPGRRHRDLSAGGHTAGAGLRAELGQGSGRVPSKVADITCQMLKAGPRWRGQMRGRSLTAKP